MTASATTTAIHPTAILRGKTFLVTREPSEKENLFMLTRGRVEFLARLNEDGTVDAFNANTNGPTMVGGKRVTVSFEDGRFYA